MSLGNNAETWDCLLNELYSQIRLVKEEIRFQFSRHKGTLASREICLLDQVDTIKEAMASMLLKQQVTLAEVKASLAECVRFLHVSKEKGDTSGAGIDHATTMIKKLQRKARECEINIDSSLPKLKFVHNSKQLRRNILSFGRLDSETECASSGDSEWDLLTEKDDTDPLVSNKQTACSVKTCCNLTLNEIEDMDFDCIQDHDLEDLPVDLREVCKANEICTTISECVCDTPCLSENLQRKITENRVDDSIHFKTGMSKSRLTEASECNDGDLEADHGKQDVLEQVRNNLTAIRSQKNSTASNSDPCQDYIGNLNKKLQNILYGTGSTNSASNDSAEFKFAVGVNDNDNDNDNADFTGLNPIDSLHLKLQGIFAGTDVASAENGQQKECPKVNSACPTASDLFGVPSSICDLNRRLQRIVDGSIDSDVELDEAKKLDVLDIKEKHKGIPCSVPDSDCVEALHLRLQHIFDEGVYADEKVDVVTEVPEVLKDDAISNLHMRIQEILQEEEPKFTGGNNFGIVPQMEDDVISVISDQMQELLSA